MHVRRVVPILLVIAAVAAGGYYFYVQATAEAGDLVVSGTIEATEVRLGSVQGGRVIKVMVEEGEPVLAGQVVAEVSPPAGPYSRGNEMIRAALNATVLVRSVEPGEIASPGTPLITLADLGKLTLTVYVPEDRYGMIKLGQSYPVTVDSFPGDVFTGQVSYISDKAEFTPRNVQTTDSRKTTVFAIKLALEDAAGQLKPGMPADVSFGQ